MPEVFQQAKRVVLDYYDALDSAREGEIAEVLLAYNEYLFVRVLAPTEWTLPVAIVSLTGGESSRTITEAAAASVSITLPIVVVIILFQKHLVKGLGAGAVKG